MVARPDSAGSPLEVFKELIEGTPEMIQRLPSVSGN